ncbi:hypothetical protein Godav_025648 [Gossypium davidsonii]|uniref:DUF4283 domain-containing protein n=1 Tax=Gossypium davidsonii TaxID=34287 RepID=A0A7J8THM5_GOSDV|nr:hypothetical protein [Gossypium davidsonii]
MTIFGHYLAVRPWMPTFSKDQPYSSSPLVWIRLLGMLKGMYTKSCLRFIGNMIGTVAKIDQNTDSTSGGQFVRLAAFIDLGKPGVGIPVFEISLSNVKKEFEPDFVVLFEIRINGCKADSVIAKLRFENSFRVEAMGFAEGIWLLWNDDIIVDILKEHTLFIHMRIWVDGN